MRMRKWLRLFVSLNLSVGLYSLLFLAKRFTQQPGKVNDNVIATRRIKSILIWNAADRFESGAEFGSGPEAFARNECAYTDCRIISNRSELPFGEYDAVVFNMMDAILQNKPEDEGYRRSGGQRFVLLSQESPATIPFLAGKFKDFFNWTMSYRFDSDIPLVYGKVHALNRSVEDDHVVGHLIERTHSWPGNYGANKTKTVAWMATHCETNGRRETYVQELAKYIDVDIYGGCGNLSCPRGKHWISNPKCYDMLADKYKFYLSFENSVCHDYVTEKFYEILAHRLVPVVYGGANYAQLAPPHSYINALEFTPQQLAHYLHRLANNDTLYNEFFWWKDHYSVEAGMRQMVRRGFCDLCRKLHQDSAVKMYHEIKSKWSKHSQCVEMAPWTANGTDSFNLTKLAAIW